MPTLRTRNNLYVLVGIQPHEFRQKRVSLSLTCHARKPKYLLLDHLLSPPYKEHQQLMSRHPFWTTELDQKGTKAAY